MHIGEIKLLVGQNTTSNACGEEYTHWFQRQTKIGPWIGAQNFPMAILISVLKGTLGYIVCVAARRESSKKEMIWFAISRICNPI